MLDKTYNLLTLDPMYSSLHEKIGNIVGQKKYAITSCLALKIYLPSFKVTLAATIIKKYQGVVSKNLLDKINRLNTYHSAYVQKVEKRTLNDNELLYMSRFYLALKEFIQKKQINLVLLHNDTRWYHAIAVMLCKELNIKYLVTEQGLIRPNTTVIDAQGINFKAKVPNGFSNNKKSNFISKHPHDSKLSMCFFASFLVLFFFEAMLSTRVKYLHNCYGLRKYAKRIIHLFKPNRNIPSKVLQPKMALLLLQLELDSQLLVYSEFRNNQEVVSNLERRCNEEGLKLAIKKHPLDSNDYQISRDTVYVHGDVASLSRQAAMVFTVNSSAALHVIKTDTALYLLGDSIYDKEFVAKKINLEANNFQEEINLKVNKEKRKNFLNMLSNDYLLPGSGFSFDKSILQKKLESLLCESEK